MSDLLRTPLFETHAKAGAKLVPFGGWEMPLHYGSILTEHHLVRKSLGLFDVSHMGRLEFAGPDAEAFLRRLLSRDVRKVEDGRSAYTLICNEAGGLIDDAIVTRFGAEFFLVVNASNRPAVLSWIALNRGSLKFDLRDRTAELAMIAAQGPHSPELARRMLGGHELNRQKYYSGTTVSYRGQSAKLFRSGYTGEEGFEIVLPAELAASFWAEAVDRSAGGPHGDSTSSAAPAGLGARDTLRLEAGMPLYGHEYSPATDGISAGMEWVIDLEGDFLGAAALRKIKAAGPARKLVGLELVGRKQARQGAVVVAGPSDPRPVGEVTSGALSPTLEKVIAMAYVDAALAAPGSSVAVTLREEHVPATVVKLPFYKRAKK